MRKKTMLMFMILFCWFVSCFAFMCVATKTYTGNAYKTNAVVKTQGETMVLQCDNGEIWKLPYMPMYTEGEEVRVIYNGQRIVGLSPINK